MFVVQLLAILISMVVYIFWFLKSEFVRVLDRIDQATLGLARLQREVGQSTLNALNDQISETLSGLQEDIYDDLGEEGEEQEEEGDEFEEPNEKRLETVEEELEGLEGLEGIDDIEEHVKETERTEETEINEKLIESVIDELDRPEEVEASLEEEEPAPPRKRGRKPKK